MTNGDMIREMTDEELCDCMNYGREGCGHTDVCKDGIRLFVKQEIPEDDRRCDSK